MKEPDKLFDVNYDKVNFKITIDVCENGSKFMVHDVADGYVVNYHTLVGVIETMKQAIIDKQSLKNRASDKKKKVKQPKA